MKRIQKIFISIGVIIFVLISAGIYVNHQLAKVVTSLSRPGILFTDVDAVMPSDDAAASNSGEDAINSSNSNKDTVNNGSAAGRTGNNNPASATPSSGNNDYIVNDVQSKIERPIEKTDLVKAGIIILKRLDSGEISYLYRVGSQDTCTKDDLRNVQKVLKTNLTDEDIATLKELGKKYGKELRILDEDI